MIEVDGDHVNQRPKARLPFDICQERLDFLKKFSLIRPGVTLNAISIHTFVL